MPTSPNPSEGGLLYFALACSLVAFAASTAHIYGHLSNFTERAQQQHIVRILVIVPVYALGSWLSLRFPNQELYFATVRDCYEAYVVYCFLALVLVYCGGDGICVAKMQEKGSIRHPFPLCRLAPVSTDGLFLRRCKQAVIQFVVIKPIFAVISLVFLGLDLYHTTGYQVVLLLVYNVSYSAALYALLLFYIATKEQLSAFQPVMKFFAVCVVWLLLLLRPYINAWPRNQVKSIVFMTYWQGLLVEVIPGVPADTRTSWQDFVLCLEMVLFALLHYCAFNYKEFSLDEGVIHTSVMQNVKHVISQKDVVQDAYHNFMPSYTDYVLHRPNSNAPPRKYRTKTFLFGNLGRSAVTSSPAQRHGQLVNLNGTQIDLDDEEEEGLGSGALVGGTQLDVSCATAGSGEVELGDRDLCSSAGSPQAPPANRLRAQTGDSATSAGDGLSPFRDGERSRPDSEQGGSVSPHRGRAQSACPSYHTHGSGGSDDESAAC